MFDATMSRLHGARASRRDKQGTGRKWKRHETALFAAIVSGGAWALIVGMATIIL
jgi:hypothetical protein